MKKLMSYVLFLMMMGFAAVAQDPDEQEPVQKMDPQAQAKINALRIAYLSDKMGLTPDQAEKFWPIYNEFAQQRVAARAELKALRNSIDPNNPDPKKQQELVDLGLKVKQRELDLEKDYSARLLKVITAQQILNLRKSEQEFRILLLKQMEQRRLNQQRRENLHDRNQRLQQRKN